MWLWKCEKKRKFLLLLLLLIAGDLPLTVASVCKTFVAPLLFGDFLLLLFFVLFCFFFILVCVFVPFSALSKKSHIIPYRFSGGVSELLATQFPQHFRRLLNFLCFVFFAWKLDTPQQKKKETIQMKLPVYTQLNLKFRRHYDICLPPVQTMQLKSVYQM